MSLSNRKNTIIWVSLPLALWLAATGILTWRVRVYYPFISDDALISLRYAHRFIHGLGLTWNDGERVEGYSNLLWVLLSSALGAVGIDLVVSLRILGMIGASLTIAGAIGCSVAASRAKMSAQTVLAMTTSALVLALSDAMAVWAIGGLEQPLLACLLAFACTASLALFGPLNAIPPRRSLLSGLLFGLLGVIRPDGILFGVAALMALYLVRPRRSSTMKHCRSFGIGALTPALTQLVFRLVYYRDWVPNTAYAKLVLKPVRAAWGLRYLKTAAADHWPILGLAALAIGILIWKKQWRPSAFFSLIFAAWSGYVALIGGDIFPAHRHIVPLITLIALLIAYGFTQIELPQWYAKLAIIASSAAILYAYHGLQAQSQAFQAAVMERWEQNGEVLGRLLKAAFGRKKPLITLDASGSIGYFSELPAIDMFGLSDRVIARHPPKNIGDGYIGHELGYGEYVLSRKPDIIIFFLGRAEPFSPGDRQIVSAPEFHRDYEYIQVQGQTPSSYIAGIWVRTNSPRVGIRSVKDTQFIPGYFFTVGSKTAAKLTAQGELGIELGDGLPAAHRMINLECGTWRLEINDASQLQIEIHGTDGFIATGKGALEIAVPKRQIYEVMTWSETRKQFLTQLNIRRLRMCNTAPNR
jgi:arabinofuranosyltransferase